VSAALVVVLLVVAVIVIAVLGFIASYNRFAASGTPSRSPGGRSTSSYSAGTT
jgi:hypothetical protein